MADVIEKLANGFMCGLNWSLDHDETVGNIGVTATGTVNPAGDTLVLHAQLIDKSTQAVLWSFNQRIDQFANQGRQVLFTSTRLVNMTIYPTNPSVELDIWSTCGP